MGHIPLLVHPEPKKVAFIGLATGLTASSAVMHRAVDSITILEVSPRVIELSLKYFSPFTGGFEHDGRVHIKEADGVYYFASTTEIFDVIVGDLFFPWRRGVNRLYSREHFFHVRSRLAPGGIFCQWLPADQLDAPAFSLIIETFRSVFPRGVLAQVFNGERRYIGLMGRNDEKPLGSDEDRLVWTKRIRAEILSDAALTSPKSFDAVFLGHLAVCAFPAGARHTLDKPVLEKAAVTLEPRLISNNSQ
jgi:spermidine synthase